jgi:hypothetical protein
MALALNLKQTFVKEMHGVDADAGHSAPLTDGQLPKRVKELSLN